MRAYRARILWALLILLVAAPLLASTYAYEQITVAGTAVGFTSAKITPSGSAPMQFAQCRLETAEIRYAYDGTTPTSSVGTLMEVGEYIAFTNHEDMLNFKAIRTGSSAALSCTYKAP